MMLMNSNHILVEHNHQASEADRLPKRNYNKASNDDIVNNIQMFGSDSSQDSMASMHLDQSSAMLRKSVDRKFKRKIGIEEGDQMKKKVWDQMHVVEQLKEQREHSLRLKKDARIKER